MKPGPLRSIGPAIIVAAVVLGPGSILASSRVGCDFGYDMLWLLGLSAVLMMGMTALAAHLGASFEDTPCTEIARAAGRPLAVLVGLVLFLVVACFQFSNNLAVIAGLRTFLGEGGAWPNVLLVALNVAVLFVLFGLRRPYRPIETMMKVLVGLMVIGFLGNLLFAHPSPGGILGGLLPSLPESLRADLVPRVVGGVLQDAVLPLQALVGTTFSVAAAFYQAYLVRERGWKRAELRAGLVDSLVGISVLGLLSATILVTAAAVLHGSVAGGELRSAADVAVQLEPLFGPWAKVLFSLGLLAAALSSFLINAMIGGTVLSDSLGLGGDLGRPMPKVFTTLALVIGLVVAISVLEGHSPVQLILFAQAMTVLGNPVLAGVMLWMSARAKTPRWIRGLAFLGFLVVLVLALRTGYRLWLS